jgi:methylisocitrate lyase
MSVRKTTLLRRALRQGCVTMPGSFNAATARLIEKSGFTAVYVSGAGLSNATAGVPDVGLLTLNEVAQLAGYIARSVQIPVIADADTGFGGPENVVRTVQEFEHAGLAGLHIEDQSFPKRCGHVEGKTLISAEEMAAKIRLAVRAKTDKDFLVIARTDARAIEGFDATVERALLYVKAGADAIFPEALQTAAEFRRFAKLVKAPLLANMTEFGKSPLLSVKELARMGYRIVIFPQTCFRAAMHAEENCLRELKKRGTQKSWLKKMQPRKELYKLLDYVP